MCVCLCLWGRRRIIKGGNEKKMQRWRIEGHRNQPLKAAGIFIIILCYVMWPWFAFSLFVILFPLLWPAAFTLYFYLHCAQRRYFITRSHEEFVVCVFFPLHFFSAPLLCAFFLAEYVWALFDFCPFLWLLFWFDYFKNIAAGSNKKRFRFSLLLFPQTFILPSFRRT